MKICSAISTQSRAHQKKEEKNLRDLCNLWEILNPDGDCGLFAISESRVKLACVMLSGAKITTKGSNVDR